MSTRIHDGLCVTLTDSRLSTVLAFIEHTVRPAILATIGARLVEMFPQGLEQFRSQCSLMAAHLREARQRREHSIADFGVELVFLPTDEEGRLLVMPFVAGRDLQKTLEGLPQVSEYGYWDNTDKPDHVTDDEWEQRRENWDKALGGDGYGIPAQCGMTTTVFPEYRIPSEDVYTEAWTVRHG